MHWHWDQMNLIQNRSMPKNKIIPKFGHKAGHIRSVMLYVRNRKHVPCFYQVIETQVEVWENEKCCENTSRRWVFPQFFQVLPNFHECFCNSIETRSTCFLFHLENTARSKRKTPQFPLLAPSLRQQPMLVLCLHQVIQTWFLTNQCACLVRTVF